MSSSVAKGDAFEEVIFDFFRREIEEGRLFSPDSCKLLKKKKYYSKDRDADIVFDVAVEFYLPGADEFSLVLLIECKNYSSPVPAADIEEFNSKAEQVAPANSKLIFASAGPLQPSALNYARSRKIGVLRYFGKQELKWELYRGAYLPQEIFSRISRFELDDAISSNSSISRITDHVLDSGRGEAISIEKLAEDSLGLLHIDRCSHPAIFRSSSSPALQVTYLSREDLEYAAENALSRFDYADGKVELELISKTIPELIVVHHMQRKDGVLGSVAFYPLTINIYETDDGRRNRFTFAHELSHVLLGHEKFILRDVCEESDLQSLEPPRFLPEEIKRIEFQANYLAASILMPKQNFERDFFLLASRYGIRNRGFGHLFLDNQPTNQSDYMRVVQRLMSKYDVSRAAVHIRLQTLGLLQDARQ
jgi:Zn-dependent peptidase ImmA (M78 family)